MSSDEGPAISVVIPTYNERHNVAPLVARLERSLAGIAAEVIFVDDSDDGTEGEILRQHTSLPLRVIHRTPRERQGGLSTAVLRGVEVATGRYVCVMDGDLQHPPETIPQLYARAEAARADIVIASRNVAGGSNQGLDGPWRRFVSYVFGMVSRVLFYEKLRKVTDPLSGFLLVRRSALQGVTLRPVGYKISLEILIRAAGSHVEEVPYTFTEREAGDSKAKLGTGVTFLRHVGLLLIEVPEVGRFWKFGFVGGTGVLVYISMLWLLTIHVGMHHAVAWALAAELAVLSNFTLNRNVTWFERRAEGASALASEGAKYHVASALSVAANGVTFFLLTTAGVGVLVAGATSVWVGVATSFLGAEKFVFTTRRAVPLRRSIVPPPRPQAPDAEQTGIPQATPVAPGAGRL
ncbi:MAG TPA: glycosyltransferase family 2 protein, partial [Methylomirabilota bacterium]|nr:glycosyltransferase family 2 protein [Methylomirabilota bacterium]